MIKMNADQIREQNANFTYLNRRWRLFGSSYPHANGNALKANTGSKMCNFYFLQIETNHNNITNKSANTDFP